MADWTGNEAPGKAGILADSCVLPEPRCPVTPTRQHIPDRDNPGDPAALTPRKPQRRHTQSATTKFAEEPNYVIAHKRVEQRLNLSGLEHLSWVAPPLGRERHPGSHHRRPATIGPQNPVGDIPSRQPVPDNDGKVVWTIIGKNPQN
jgi:hypothetical protein